MIKLENFEVIGWEHAIRGMRNPMNSWEKSDSGWNASMPPLELRSKVDWYEYAKNYITVLEGDEYDYDIGPNDQALMMRLSKNGPVHAKYRRMITVYVDITAPLYWWKEFDTYKVGTVANSCSTMHKIHEKEFTLDDFSCEHLLSDDDYHMDNFESLLYEDGKEVERPRIYLSSPIDDLQDTISKLNLCRRLYLDKSIKGDKKIYWWQMIQLLPSSYNQKRTIMLNYEVLANIYKSRKDHKLDEWHTFCDWIESLPYAELITGEKK